jgi:YD repeat-containing protein
MSKVWTIALLLAIATNLRAQVPRAADVAASSRTLATSVADVAPGFSPPPRSHATDGDPVDLFTGLYERTSVDLIVPDAIPIQLSRTYRNDDHRSRAFGIGTSHPYDMFIAGDAQAFTYVELILANGYGIHYDRISPGKGYADAIFENTDLPTEFFHSEIRWNGTGWTVTLTNGSSYKILGCSPNTTIPGKCGVIEFGDGHGNAIHIERQPNGNVARILSPNGKWVAFTYDSQDRVVLAEASTGDVVQYQYDDLGRLIKVTRPDQDEPVSRYEYDDDDRMTGAFERDQQIANEYDREHCIHQLWQSGKESSEFSFKYIFDGQDRHVATEVRQPPGDLRRVTFNAVGDALTDTYAVGTPDEASLIYERDPRTNSINSFIVTCSSGDRAIQVKTSIGPIQPGEELPADAYIDSCRREAATPQQ